MARALTGLGAKCVYFDIVFSEPSNEKDDMIFEETLKSTNYVYLPVVYRAGPSGGRSVLNPISRFASHVKATGPSNIFPDIDGIVRKTPLVFVNDHEMRPHIALQISMDYLGSGIAQKAPDHIKLFDGKAGLLIPLAGKDQMIINWPGKWETTFTHYSFLDVLVAYKDLLDGKKTAIDTNIFKDSICLIGATATGLLDIKPTPLQSQYPGIGIMASTINTVLGKKFIAISPAWVNIALLYIMALLPALLIHGNRPLRETVFVFLISIAYWLIYFALFTRGFMIQLVVPLLGFFISYTSVETYNFFLVAIERQKFLKMSVTDSLTGLYNMLYFNTALKREIARAGANPDGAFSVVMIDIDRFKIFNDKYGHQVGDMVLKKVAEGLKNSVRALDVISRYGGEEFMILLIGAGLKSGVVVAEKMRRNVEAYAIVDGGNSYKVTISLGVAALKKSDTPETIIKRADDALYSAKESGRNTVCSIDL